MSRLYKAIKALRNTPSRIVFRNFLISERKKKLLFISFFALSCYAGWVFIQPLHSEKQSGDTQKISSRNLTPPEVIYTKTRMPQILSTEERQRYKDIFLYQKEAEWSAADEQIALLQSPILLGHIKAERLLHEKYKSSKEELLEWVESYPNLPESYKIFRLAAKHKPELLKASYEIRKNYLFGYGDDFASTTGNTDDKYDAEYWEGHNRAQKVWGHIEKLLDQGRLVAAYKTVRGAKAKRWLSKEEQGDAQWNVANAFLVRGKEKAAFSVIHSAGEEAWQEMPQMQWIAGMIAWRTNDWPLAVRHFSDVANAKKLNKWENAAGAYWAFRAYREMKEFEKAREMLESAARFPRTFYGILATHALGKKPTFNWNSEPLTVDDIAMLMQSPYVQRALAFKELGYGKLAEKEIRKFFPKASEKTKRKLVAFARENNMPTLQVVMARRVAGGKGGHMDDALNPIPLWKPENGFKVNPSLLFAMIKKESGFNPTAKSHKNAIGLMQIKPDTAKYIQNKMKAESGAIDLTNPITNITLGQSYIQYLLRHPTVEGNVLFMLAAYNAGPGRLGEWLDEMEFEGDPLMFIEMLPVRETRDYVKQAMANYWMYADRLKEEGKSIESLLQGRWPVY